MRSSGLRRGGNRYLFGEGGELSRAESRLLQSHRQPISSSSSRRRGSLQTQRTDQLHFSQLLPRLYLPEEEVEEEEDGMVHDNHEGQNHTVDDQEARTNDIPRTTTTTTVLIETIPEDPLSYPPWSREQAAFYDFPYPSLSTLPLFLRRWLPSDPTSTQQPAIRLELPTISPSCTFVDHVCTLASWAITHTHRDETKEQEDGEEPWYLPEHTPFLPIISPSQVGAGTWFIRPLLWLYRSYLPTDSLRLAVLWPVTSNTLSTLTTETVGLFDFLLELPNLMIMWLDPAARHHTLQRIQARRCTKVLYSYSLFESPSALQTIPTYQMEEWSSIYSTSSHVEDVNIRLSQAIYRGCTMDRWIVANREMHREQQQPGRRLRNLRTAERRSILLSSSWSSASPPSSSLVPTESSGTIVPSTRRSTTVSSRRQLSTLQSDLTYYQDQLRNVGDDVDMRGAVETLIRDTERAIASLSSFPTTTTNTATTPSPSVTPILLRRSSHLSSLPTQPIELVFYILGETLLPPSYRSLKTTPSTTTPTSTTQEDIPNITPKQEPSNQLEETKGDDTYICPICYDSLVANRSVTWFPCGHVVDEECVRGYFESEEPKYECPSCRRSLGDTSTKEEHQLCIQMQQQSKAVKKSDVDPTDPTATLRLVPSRRSTWSMQQITSDLLASLSEYQELYPASVPEGSSRRALPTSISAMVNSFAPSLFSQPSTLSTYRPSSSTSSSTYNPSFYRSSSSSSRLW